MSSEWHLHSKRKLSVLLISRYFELTINDLVLFHMYVYVFIHILAPKNFAIANQMNYSIKGINYYSNLKRELRSHIHPEPVQIRGTYFHQMRNSWKVRDINSYVLCSILILNKGRMNGTATTCTVSGPASCQQLI